MLRLEKVFGEAGFSTEMKLTSKWLGFQAQYIDIRKLKW